MAKATLALLLHAHLPFVRHPEQERFHEETWLFEAVTECYLPLLNLLERLAGEGAEFQISLSLTPPLASMLCDPLLQQRCQQYMEEGLARARELQRNPHTDPPARDLGGFYATRFEKALADYVHRWNRDLTSAFLRLQESGHLELLGSAATHGYLPLLEVVPEAVRAQILIGCDEHREVFGSKPRGFWLPECAYTPGLEPVLREAGVEWSVLDAHGILFGHPRPLYAVYRPCRSPSGLTFFGRDREASRQIWSAEEGYPGDPAYREFYSDLAWESLPGMPGSGTDDRLSGIKLRRITGPGPEKEYYRRDWAMAAADAHASHFLQNRLERLQSLSHPDGPAPLLLCPFDAELFGHWWYEGPEFLEFFLRKAIHDQDLFQLKSPGNFLEREPTHQLLQPTSSSWGDRGYSNVWLDPVNQWIYPELHRASQQMVERARQFAETCTPRHDRILRQMGRELLLAQSSDWAFLMKANTAGAYATERTRDHLRRFTELETLLNRSSGSLIFLSECEQRHTIFPNLNWRHYT